MNLFDLRNDVVNVFGPTHPASVAVSRAVLTKLRQDWLPCKPRKPSVHFLLTPAYQAKIRGIYARQPGQAYTNKIPAIKRVRTDWENKHRDRLGLLEAKLYVEWICDHAKEPEFVRNLKGYLPF